MRLSRRSRFLFSLLIPILIFSLGDVAAPSGVPVFFSSFKLYDWNMGFNAGRFDLVIWHNHPKTIRTLPELRQIKPDIIALLYRELFCVLKEETQLAESVGHYDWIIEHHPDWFQRDIDGNRIEVPHYPGRFMMDLGNEEWQDFWIEQTLSDVRAGGWDGVFVDDALTSVRMHDLPVLNNYPDDESLQKAVYTFLAKIHAAFAADGKMMLANVSNSYDYPGLFAQWLAVTDGIMEEHCSGDALTWGPHVGAAQLQAMQTARRAGKWYLCMSYGAWDDQKRMDMSYATYLMGSGERVAWSYRPEKNGSEDVPHDPIWITTVGQPLAEPFEVNGVWIRKFSGGTLFVNPTKDPETIDYQGEQITVLGHSFLFQ